MCGGGGREGVEWAFSLRGVEGVLFFFKGVRLDRGNGIFREGNGEGGPVYYFIRKVKKNRNIKSNISRFSVGIVPPLSVFFLSEKP